MLNDPWDDKPGAEFPPDPFTQRVTKFVGLCAMVASGCITFCFIAAAIALGKWVF